MEVEFGVRLEDITAEHLNEEMPLDELEAKGAAPAQQA